MPDFSSIVIPTGAGISAESGLQTFRAADEVREGHRVEGFCMSAFPIADIAFGWNKCGMATGATDFEYTSATIPSGALFVAADEPLLVYPSVAAAERHLEATDVENGVYPAAYGPNGEPYRIASESNRVIIEATGEPSRPEEFRLLLLRYLEATDRAPDATATLEDLVATVWAVESDFWKAHDPYGDRFGTRISPWGCAAFVVVVAIVLYFAVC